MKEVLAKDNMLCLTLARKALKWDEPPEPSKIVGPLHYVGTAGLSWYLFGNQRGPHPLQHWHARLWAADCPIHQETGIRSERHQDLEVGVKK